MGGGEAHAAMAPCCCCTRYRSKNGQHVAPSQMNSTRSMRYNPTRTVDAPEIAYASGTRSTLRRRKPGIGHPCAPKKKMAYATVDAHRDRLMTRCAWSERLVYSPGAKREPVANRPPSAHVPLLIKRSCVHKLLEYMQTHGS